MDITLTTLILVGVICVLLGFLISSLLGTLHEDEFPSMEDGLQAPPGGTKGRYLPLVRLWRDKKNATIVVESNGKTYSNALPLDEAQREELERIAREFRGWLGIGLNPTVSKMDNSAAPSVNQSPANQVEAENPPANVIMHTPVQKPVINQTAKTIVMEEVVSSTGNKSIVMQIDDVLQDMLAQDPSTSKPVHLSEDPKRGVIVSVGAIEYEGIDMVPDYAVQAQIRAAVAAWEKSQS
jgi:hypothetical protein